MTAKNNHTIFATRERTLAKKSNKKKTSPSVGNLMNGMIRPNRWQSNERKI